MNLPGTRTSLAFSAAVATSVLLIAGLCLFVASREWFSRDDFAFLAMARDEGWSWLEVYLPLEKRTWPVYRPVGVQTFFRIGVGLFGIDAFSFMSVIVAVHLATGLWVWRLALQLGFAAPVALVTAVLSVSRHPSLTEIFYGAMFQYVALCFCSAASLSLFLDYTRRGRVRWQVGSCLALALALLCNEGAVTTPAALVLVSALAGGRSLRALVEATRRALPQIAITLGYLVLRFGIVAQVETSRLLTPSLGPHVPRNLAHLVQQFFGDERVLVITGLLLLAVLATSVATSALRANAGSWLLWTSAACIGWTLLALAPFALLRFPQLRWSLPAEVPLSLLIGAAGCALWRLVAARWRPALEFGMLGLVIASVPYGTLLARAADPLGAYPQRLAEFVESHDLRGSGARLVVLYGGDGLASKHQAELSRRLVYGGGLFKVLYPGAKLRLLLHDLNEKPKRGVLLRSCVYIVLLPDLTLELADEALVDREMTPWMSDRVRRHRSRQRSRGDRPPPSSLPAPAS